MRRERCSAGGLGVGAQPQGDVSGREGAATGFPGAASRLVGKPQCQAGRAVPRYRAGQRSLSPLGSAGTVWLCREKGGGERRAAGPVPAHRRPQLSVGSGVRGASGAFSRRSLAV